MPDDPIKRPLPRPPVGVRKKKPGKTPITKTVGEREVGIGGLRRQRVIDDIVDEAQTGTKR